MLSQLTKEKNLCLRAAKNSLCLLGFLHLLGLLGARACKQRLCLAVEMPQRATQEGRGLRRSAVQLRLAGQLGPEGSEARIGVLAKRHGAVPQAPSAGIPHQTCGEATTSDTPGEGHFLKT